MVYGPLAMKLENKDLSLSINGFAFLHAMQRSGHHVLNESSGMSHDPKARQGAYIVGLSCRIFDLFQETSNFHECLTKHIFAPFMAIDIGFCSPHTNTPFFIPRGSLDDQSLSCAE
jgi:hypothetical protein